MWSLGGRNARQVRDAGGMDRGRGLGIVGRLECQSSHVVTGWEVGSWWEGSG